MICSPSVFQTAPPQPRSNARWIWPPLLVGGALASQNGLGDLMPAQLMLRSAMIVSSVCLRCHAELVEASLSLGKETPRQARGDKFGEMFTHIDVRPCWRRGGWSRLSTNRRDRCP